MTSNKRWLTAVLIIVVIVCYHTLDQSIMGRLHASRTSTLEDDTEPHLHGRTERTRRTLEIKERCRTESREHEHPGGCRNKENYQCLYSVDYNFNKLSDLITFTFMFTYKPDVWVAIGFSLDGGMRRSDILLGYMKDEVAVVKDLFAPTRAKPIEDTLLEGKNDVTNITSSVVDGVAKIEFARKRDTGDVQTDYKFDDEKSCWKVLYATGPVLEGTFAKHDQPPPQRSEEEYCIKECLAPNGKRLIYQYSITLRDLLFTVNLIDKVSSEFRKLKRELETALMSAYEELSLDTLRRITVSVVEFQSQRGVKVTYTVDAAFEPEENRSGDALQIFLHEQLDEYIKGNNNLLPLTSYYISVLGVDEVERTTELIVEKDREKRSKAILFVIFLILFAVFSALILKKTKISRAGRKNSNQKSLRRKNEKKIFEKESFVKMPNENFNGVGKSEHVTLREDGTEMQTLLPKLQQPYSSGAKTNSNYKVSLPEKNHKKSHFITTSSLMYFNKQLTQSESGDFPQPISNSFKNLVLKPEAVPSPEDIAIPVKMLKTFQNLFSSSTNTSIQENEETFQSAPYYSADYEEYSSNHPKPDFTESYY